MIREFKIPDKYYKYAAPFRTDYLKGNNNGLCYKPGGEEAFEMAAAFGGTPDNQSVVIALTSPYICGFENMNKVITLIDVDLEERKVIVDIEV